MLINEFIKAGEVWDAYKQSYRSQKESYKKSYETQKAQKINEQGTLYKKINDLKLKINQNEESLRALVSETFESVAFERIKRSVSAFGITSSKRDRSIDIENVKSELKRALLEKKACEARVPKIQDEINELDKAYQEKDAKLDNDYQSKKQETEKKVIAKYDAETKRCVRKYSSKTTVPEPPSLPPKKVILGTQRAVVSTLNDVLPGPIYMPYEVDVKDNGSFAINVSQNALNSRITESIMVGMLLKYIDSFPAKKLHIGVFSPTLASFNHLNALYNAMKSEGCTVLPEGISSANRIDELFNAIDVKAKGIRDDKILRSGLSNIFDLYDAGQTTETFTVVVLHNALSSLNDEEINKLSSFIKGYHRCGVRFIIVEDFSSINTRSSINYARALDEIKQSCTRIDINEKGIARVDGIETSMMSLMPDFDEIKVYNYCIDYLKKEKKSAYVTYESIGFGKETPDADEYTRILIPVATTGSGAWHMKFACEINESKLAPIANLILGESGSGKSCLIESMIYNASMKYSPDDLIFHFLDFKQNSTAGLYLNETYKIPHIKVLTADSKPEEASFILDNILEENIKRIKTFSDLGEKYKTAIKNIAQYNKFIVTNGVQISKMPRLIIIVDECQYLFASDALVDKLTSIVRLGRSQGIHIVLATQTLNSTMRSWVSKFVNGLYVYSSPQEDIEAILDKQYHKRVNTEAPVGSFQCFASDNGGSLCTKITPAFYGDPPEPISYSNAIRSKWSSYPCDTVVIGEKRDLYINNEDYQKILGKLDNYKIAFGENYQNREPFYFELKQKIGQGVDKIGSVVLIGDNDVIASSLCTSVLLSAKRNKTKVYAIDMSRSQTLATIKSKCFDSDSSIFVGKGADYNSTIAKVYMEYEARCAEFNNDPSAKFEPIILMINSADRINDYNNNTLYEIKAEQKEKKSSADSNNPCIGIPGYAPLDDYISDEESDTNNEYSAKIKVRDALYEILKKGADYGIVVCLWANDNEEIKAKQTGFIKLAFNAIPSNISSYFDNSFYERMTDGMSQTMAFVNHYDATVGRLNKRIRVYQYDLDDEDLIKFIRTL